MQGLMTICHDARKGGYIGSHWPKHLAPLLYSTKKFCAACESFDGYYCIPKMLRRDSFV
jgi:hypothetical protein